MEYRRLLRPLPLFLIAIFVAVAVVDLFHKLAEESPPPPKISGAAIGRFEPIEPVIDFRPEHRDADVEILPVPEFAQGEWSAPTRSGVWAKGDAAEFSLLLGSGGHRVVVVQGMPTSGDDSPRRLRLTINGVDCGEVAVVRGWHRYRFAVPEGTVQAGANRVVFGFPDVHRVGQKRRVLLIRRIGWFLGPDEVEIAGAVRSVSVDLSAGKIAFLRSGTFELPLDLEDRTDALQMRYRFSSAGGRVDVGVTQSLNDEGGIDAAPRESVSAEERLAGRIRIPLHGRRGAYLLRIRADLPVNGGRLQISSLRFVEEGDPSRPPGSSDSPRD